MEQDIRESALAGCDGNASKVRSGKYNARSDGALPKLTPITCCNLCKYSKQDLLANLSNRDCELVDPQVFNTKLSSQVTRESVAAATFYPRFARPFHARDLLVMHQA